ncbi:MAG: hypothetical protein ABI239_10515 [Aquihabitans sp.]
MLTVAIIGADGSGKSTVTRLVVEHLGIPARRVYLGVSAASATHPLPTTRLLHWFRVVTARPLPATGPPEIGPGAVAPRTGRAQIRALGRLANRVTEEAYQEIICRWHRLRGRVVVCDRFYLADFHAHDLSDRRSNTWDRRLHGAFLRRFLSSPDLVVFLTAPVALLHERKGEGSLEALSRRQAECASYAQTVAAAVTVDASRSSLDVADTVIVAIRSRLQDLPEPTLRPLAESLR